MATDNLNAIIENATAFILGEPNVHDNVCKTYVADTIFNIRDALEEYGPPTDTMLEMSIEIAKLQNCTGHLTTIGAPWPGETYALKLITYALHLYVTKDPIAQTHSLHSPAAFGHKFARDVCQACPAFLAAIRKVHAAGFTPKTITERAKIYYHDMLGITL